MTATQAVRALLAALLFAGLGWPLRAGAAEKKAPRRNVLFLIADDLNCDVGAYGAPGMHTPHIDRLAARGVQFERAYCQYPLCSPSRSSFLTGRRPNVTGVLRNPAADSPVSPHFREKIPDTMTLPQLFKKSGWFAARVGKLFHYSVPSHIGTSSLDDFYSWDLVINPRGRDREVEKQIHTLIPGRFGATLSWLADQEGEDGDHTDGIGAADAIRLLERFKRDRRPFFLAVGFYRPHTPFIAPAKHFAHYPFEQVKLPSLSAADRARVPAAAYASARPEEDNATDEQRRSAIQAYHASTTFMDAQVGRVVAALDRLELAQNTVIVFTSDHGYHLGDHGLWQKHSLFERSVRVPLIIAAPGAAGNGRSTPAIAELIDIYPTLADLCGIAAPDYLDGRSQRPVLEEVTREVRTAAFSQVGRGTPEDGYAVRSGRWRYMEWGGTAGARLLFDEEGDPGETRNLVDDPRHAAVVAELSALVQVERARR